MKSLSYPFLVMLLFILANYSCTTEKRLYMSGYNLDLSNNTNSNERTAQDLLNIIDISSSKNIVATIDESKIPLLVSEPVVVVEMGKCQESDSCDYIALKSGEEIFVKVTSIENYEVKYIQCDSLDGTELGINKSDILFVRYSDGEKEVFNSVDNGGDNIYSDKLIDRPEDNYDTFKLKTEPIGIISALVGVAALLFFFYWKAIGFGLLLALIGKVLGGVSLSRIKKKPDKYKGKGYAILGIIEAIIIVLFLATVVVIVWFGIE